MLKNLDSALGSSIIATDGEIGKAYDVFFDDRSWAVRYLIVETGSWFSRRKALISPEALGRPDWIEKKIPVFLTSEQVRNSPDIDTDQPVSRQQQRAMIRHYGWAALEPSLSPYPWRETSVPEDEAESEEEGDPHLRSAKEIAGYQAVASDGTLGSISDFVIDDKGWGISDLVVNVESATEDHKVLVPTRWVSEVSWEDRQVQLTHRREQAVGAGFLSHA